MSDATCDLLSIASCQIYSDKMLLHLGLGVVDSQCDRLSALSQPQPQPVFKL